MRNKVDHDDSVAELVDGTPTAKNQNGMTYGEYLEEMEKEEGDN